MKQLTFQDNFLKKFRVFKDSCPDPDWKMLRDKRCPECSCKLKTPLDESILYCKSKKHKKSFTITRKRYNEIINNDRT